MATRVTNPPPKPSQRCTLDQAYHTAWRSHETFLRGCYSDDPTMQDLMKLHLESVAVRLTQDLIDSGVTSTLAYQLARPPSPE